jgi:hypothetical protein
MLDVVAAMAWLLRREGCHNINWVGGEAVIHLHTIVDAIALLGRDFVPTPAEIKRARKTKADRFFWFDEMPDAALYDGKFNAPMLWNSNFFMTPESMKILRVLTDVWLPGVGPRDPLLLLLPRQAGEPLPAAAFRLQRNRDFESGQSGGGCHHRAKHDPRSDRCNWTDDRKGRRADREG